MKTKFKIFKRGTAFMLAAALMINQFPEQIILAKETDLIDGTFHTAYSEELQGVQITLSTKGNGERYEIDYIETPDGSEVTDSTATFFTDETGNYTFTVYYYETVVSPPVVDIPQVETPEIDIPEIDMPEIGIPEIDVPEVDVPEVDIPEIGIPEVDIPQVETTTRQTYIMKTPKEVRTSEASEINQSKTSSFTRQLRSVKFTKTLVETDFIASVSDVQEIVTVLNIPDSEFRKVIIETILGRRNDPVATQEVSLAPGEIAPKEYAIYSSDLDIISKATYLDFNAKTNYIRLIKDTTGLEYFVALEELNIYGNPISTIDLSKNTELRKLSIGNTHINKLDLSGNTKLTYLNCAGNSITELDLSGNTKLTYLYCAANSITELDLSSNSELEEVHCNANEIEILNLSNSPKLFRLECLGNSITELDISNSPKLSYLDCTNNIIKELDLSSNPELKKVHCPFNEIEILNLSNSTELSYLDCTNNNIKELDLSNTVNLVALSCANNNITKLDVGNNSKLKTVSCSFNGMTDIDLTGALKLLELYCTNNNLTNLDLSNNSELYFLYSSENSLTDLDLSNNLNLLDLDVRSNPLTSLDLSNNTKLKSVIVGSNHLTSLDFSKSIMQNIIFHTYDQSIDIKPNLMGNGEYTLDIKNVDPNFDINKVVSISDGTIKDGIIYVDPSKPSTIQYSYDAGKNYNNGTLNVTVNLIYNTSKYNTDLDILGEGRVNLSHMNDIDAGTTVNISTLPEQGWVVKSISLDGSPITGTSFIMPNHDVSLSVVFEKDTNGNGIPDIDETKYSVSLNKIGNGTVFIDKTTDLFPGETVNFTSTPNEGWELKSLLLDGTPITGSSFIMPAHDVSLSVVFEKIATDGGNGGGSTTNYFDIQYIANHGGIIQGQKNQHISEGNSTLSVTALPANGYEFVKWNDGLTNASRHEENVLANASYTAAFRKIAITPNPNPDPTPTPEPTPMPIPTPAPNPEPAPLPDIEDIPVITPKNDVNEEEHTQVIISGSTDGDNGNGTDVIINQNDQSSSKGDNIDAQHPEFGQDSQENCIIHFFLYLLAAAMMIVMLIKRRQNKLEEDSLYN